jgi:transcriptional regulator with XRE-family HTH domain
MSEPRHYRVPTGGELRAIRTSVGLSQKEVARRVDIGAKTLRRWENDKSAPTADKLRELLAFYRITGETGQAPDASGRGITTKLGSR